MNNINKIDKLLNNNTKQFPYKIPDESWEYWDEAEDKDIDNNEKDNCLSDITKININFIKKFKSLHFLVEDNLKKNKNDIINKNTKIIDITDQITPLYRMILYDNTIWHGDYSGYGQHMVTNIIELQWTISINGSLDVTLNIKY